MPPPAAADAVVNCGAGVVSGIVVNAVEQRLKAGELELVVTACLKGMS
jgi:hypothetical protein